jgi:Ca2+/Na+ antiporter
MSLAWIFAYSYVIVWFTYVVTTAYNLHFSILPMILYPFGIALRDYKKFNDMRMALKAFKESEKVRDQKLSLAETFSGPIFQITGLMGLTWSLYIMGLGADYVQF